MTSAVFVDRDGVLVEDKGYVHKLEDFRMIPNAAEGLRLLGGYKLFIITNQAGLGKGIFTMEDFNKFSSHLLKELGKHSIKIEKMYFCPHKPEDNCECRKPKTKLIKDAEKEFNIDLSKSFMGSITSLGNSSLPYHFHSSHFSGSITFASPPIYSALKNKTT